MIKLKAQFPYFGGKAKAAHLVWERFGDVPNYVSPFFGSGAVELLRPHYNTRTRQFKGKPWRTETVNDIDCYLANYWRAVEADRDAVVGYADWPINEADLHARHNWLVNSAESAEFRQRMMTDPEYYDAKIAGWWVWGRCAWIGKGWCDSRAIERADEHHSLPQQIPHLGDNGRGDAAPVQLHAKRPNLSQGGIGRGDASAKISFARPQLRPGQGINDRKRNLLDWTGAISDRLRTIRVCCGDWSRIVGKSPTYKIGLTGLFLDPPYSAEEKRAGNLYSQDSLTVAQDVRRWLFEEIDDTDFSGMRYQHPKLRIAYCGYEGLDFPDDWECVAWKANGGYGNQRRDGSNNNGARERIWFSPACLKPSPAIQTTLI